MADPCRMRPGAAARKAVSEAGDTRDRPPWPVAGVRAVLDGLNDAIVVADRHRTIRHANPATERLLGWTPEDLTGHAVTEFLPDFVVKRLRKGFEEFVTATAARLAGRPVPLLLRHRDGRQLMTEVVLSVLDHPFQGKVVVVMIRPRSDRRIQRWNDLTSELLEIVASAPVDEPAAGRLLGTLGHRLRWDVATLWAADPSGALICRHVWTRDGVGRTYEEEKHRDPTRGSEGVPRWVLDNGEPTWVSDLSGDERFATRAIRADGLQSAYAFPVRHRRRSVGVVMLLSQRRREPDASTVELTTVVSDHLGEFLHAAALTSEREHLVAELERVRRSQEYLLLASRVLSAATDYRATIERLAQVAVPVLADLCLIDVLDEAGNLQRMAAWHADPTKRELTEELRVRYPPDPNGFHPSVEVMRTGKSLWSPEMPHEFLVSTCRDERHVEMVKALGSTSYMTVPLRVGTRILGTVTLVSAGSGRRFDATDLATAEQLASQVASVVDRARILDRERRISHELQQNLLPEAIPAIEGWSLATRYVPAAQGVQVGGDWFDVVRLGGHSLALVVGDVEGHDIEAAKVMGRLRHNLSLLLVEEQAPGPALNRLNKFLLASGADRIATVLAMVLDTVTGTLSVASAGHPPALIVGRRGARHMSVRPGPPLGVPGGCYPEQRTTLGTDSLLLFTDGLFERPGVAIDDRLAQLVEVATSSPSLEPEPLADHVLSGMLPDGSGDDDVALLAVSRR